MTRTEVDATVSRLKVGVLEMRNTCGGCAMCETRLRDLEALRQHDEAQAAEIERLRAALLAAAEHHDQFLSDYDEERAAIYRAAAEGKP